MPILGGSAATPSPPPPTVGVATAATTSPQPPYVRNWIMTGYYSKHFREDNLERDNNNGIFFEHDFNKTWGFYVGEYENSGKIESHLLTATYEPVHFGNFSLGVFAGAIDGYMQLNHGHFFFPAGLPYLTFANRGVKVNLICVPPVLKTAPAVCSLQLGVNLGDSKLDL